MQHCASSKYQRGGTAINKDIGAADFANRAAPFAVPILPARVLVAPAANIHRAMRLLDVILALIILVLILPVLVLIALAVKCTSPGPVIFAHDRVGRGGRMFSCLKFRTMVANADDALDALLAGDPAQSAEWSQTHKLRNDPRITRVGAVLRKTSLDELPQMLNVLHGKMSLVGPRPIVPAEIDRYGRYISHYCSVRPGITGMWQINGRNNISYSRRVALDVLYIRSRSLRLNFYILGMTVPSVVFATGTY